MSTQSQLANYRIKVAVLSVVVVLFLVLFTIVAGAALTRY